MKKQIFLATALLIGASALLSGCGSKKKEEVVVYTAVDEVFAEEMIRDFEKETGISVQIVYDTESNKTTGLVNRILAEEGERKMVENGFFDISIRDAGKEGKIKGMTISLEEIYDELDRSTEDMEELFAIAQ